jgi:cell division protein FtsZ
MVEAGVEGVEFIAVNADAQAIHNSKAQVKLHIGKETTKGLGAGADPVIGQRAADESKEDIRKALEGADMVFVTLGAGGGTGSGAGPIVAQIAKDMGILVVGFATKPFAFEGEKRRRNAEMAINSLRKSVDTLIIVPNDRLLQTIDRQTPLLEAFKVADDVLRQGVQGISDLITVHGLINLDFADVKAVMSNAGSALMGIGRASGENRAVQAAQQAIESPLLEISIDGARGILFNVIGGDDLTMHEINTAAEAITTAADPEANIIFGATINPDLEGEIIITVVATGFDASYFTNRRAATGTTSRSTIVSTETDEDKSMIKKNDDNVMGNLDMNLDDTDPGDDFHNDNTGPSMWTMDDDKEEGDTEDSDKQDKSDSDDEQQKDPDSPHVINGVLEDENEIEKQPSFLRRLKNRRKSNQDDDNADE